MLTINRFNESQDFQMEAPETNIQSPEQFTQNIHNVDKLDSESGSLAQHLLPEPVDHTSALTMTVSEFIDKCRTIEPLVAELLKDFIESRGEEFGHSNMSPEHSEEHDTVEPDITFSHSIEPHGQHQEDNELNFPA